MVDDDGKEAVTEYEIIEKRADESVVALVRPITGRTHQIRVHMSYIGHPLAGDDVYGPKKVITELDGQCLHAIRLGFIHPVSGKYMEFESELPEYFSKFLRKIENR